MKKLILILFLLSSLLLINYYIAVDDEDFLNVSEENYSIIIYTKDRQVIAEDKDGNIISEGVAGADDSWVIKAAIDRIKEGKILLAGSFKITSPIDNLKSDIILKGIKGETKFDCSRIESSALSAGEDGYSTSVVRLADDIRAGRHVVKLENAENLHKGDFIKLTDDYEIASFIDDHFKVYFKNGQIFKILDIIENTIILDKDVKEDYLMERNASIRKLNFTENITIECIEFTGPGMDTSPSLIDGYLLKEFIFKDNIVQYFGERALILTDSIDTTIEKNSFSYIFEPGTGYAISLGNACENISISDNVFEGKGRHYIACSAGRGTNLEGGFCRDIEIFNNYFKDSIQEAINTHEPFIGPLNITNNTFESCDKGVEITNGNSFIHNNVFINCGNAIAIFAGDEERSYNISSNVFQNCHYNLIIEIGELDIYGNISDVKFYLNREDLIFV